MSRQHKIENVFEHRGFTCVVIGQSIGHRCGYVAIPQSHKLFGVDYNEVDIDVHGGLTYGEYMDADLEVNENGGMYEVTGRYPKDLEGGNFYWLGFDCAHYNDAKDFDLIRELCDKDSADFIINLEQQFDTGGTVKDVSYVRAELVSMVDQIIELGEAK